MCLDELQRCVLKLGEVSAAFKPCLTGLVLGLG